MANGAPVAPAWPTEQVVLRPRSLPEIGDLASRFLHRHIAAFAVLLPVCLLPSAAAILLLRRGASAEACWALVLALGPVATACATVLCGELMLHPRASTRVVLRRWGRALPTLIGVRIVDVLGKWPTFGVLFRWTAFFPEVVALEHGGFAATTRRTGSLLGVVPGRWLGLLAMILVAQFVGAWAGEVAWQALRWLFAMPPAESALLTKGVSWPALLGLGVGQTYLAVVRFLVYIDCRTRREGWDLAVQFAGLCQAARATAQRSAS